MYQNVIIAKNPDMSRKTVGIESVNKAQRTTRTKITRRNTILAKLTITNKRISTRRKRWKIICEKCHRRHNLQQTIYRENIKPRA